MGFLGSSFTVEQLRELTDDDLDTMTPRQLRSALKDVMGMSITGLKKLTKEEMDELHLTTVRSRLLTARELSQADAEDQQHRLIDRDSLTESGWIY